MKRFILAFVIAFIAGCGYASAKEEVVEIVIDFPAGSAVIDPEFADNAENIERIVRFISDVDADNSVSITKISFCGAASPEGSAELNRSLASERLSALESLVRSRMDISAAAIERDDTYIPWNRLRQSVAASDIAYKDNIIKVIDCEGSMVDYGNGRTIDSRVAMLQKMDGGEAWADIHDRFFKDMRTASVVIAVNRRDVAETEPISPTPAEPECELPALAEEIFADEADFAQHVNNQLITPPYLYIKTNLIGWAMGMVNLGVEVDMARHWSFALPIYYSSWNYFTYSLKFRTLDFKPEFRYWISPANEGWFFGVHGGAAWYDFGFKGKYRYQDHDGHTPALGGGISAGYRLPISKNRRWHVEFGVSGGVYRLHYDKFLNVPDGRRVGSEKRTYAGLDEVAVSFSYSFSLKKKGGEK